MKKLLYFILLFPLYFFGQVGIGTTSPNASLEIESSNQATPSNTDGLLIPKVDEFPATNPGGAQNGMLFMLLEQVYLLKVSIIGKTYLLLGYRFKVLNELMTY